VELGVALVTLNEGDRESFVYSDYVALRALTDLSVTMLGQVQSYTRETGELLVDVSSFNGAGSYTGWEVRIAAAPDLAHAGRTDNPHETTAAQVGAYTGAQVDDMLDDAIAAINNTISGFGFMQQSLNLQDLPNKGQARLNLGVQAAIPYTTVNKAGDTMTGSLAGPEFRASGNVYRYGDGSIFTFWNGANFVSHRGTFWDTFNFNPATKQDAGTAWNTSNFNPATKQNAATAWNTSNFDPSTKQNNIALGTYTRSDGNDIRLGWSGTTLEVHINGTFIGTVDINT
jgi:hypothetical protein